MENKHGKKNWYETLVTSIIHNKFLIKTAFSGKYFFISMIQVGNLQSTVYKKQYVIFADSRLNTADFWLINIYEQN